MKSPVYYHYLRKPWRKWTWRLRRLEHLLRHNPELRIAYIEWKLLPLPTYGQHLANTMLQLIFEATVAQNLITNIGKRPPGVSFLKRPARRPGWRFHVPPGTKFKPELKVTLA